MAVNRRSLLGLGLALLALLGGCPSIEIPGVNAIRVTITNDTFFDVDPRIRFDDDPGLLAGLFPAETLSAGVLSPGESASFTFACDELGTIFSDNAEQAGSFGSVRAGDSHVLERDDEFECGDSIRFRFVGNGGSFDVVATVNGSVVN